MTLTWGWLWIQGALGPPGAILERARQQEEIRMGGKRDEAEPTARVKGPCGAVVIPLRITLTRPDEVRRLIRLTFEQPPSDTEEEQGC